MNSKTRFALSTISLLAVALTTSGIDAGARGGGGGGGEGGRGFGGGGFDRGGFGGDRGGFDRGGFADRGFDERADNFLRGDDGFGGGRNDLGATRDAARPDAFSNTSRVSENELRSGADHEYGQASLSTDSGFSRIASTIPAGARTYRTTPASLADNGSAIRSNFRNYNLYDHNWWNGHPNAWRYPYYGNYGWPWAYSDWGGLAGFWGMSGGLALPVYDYGDNITYDNDEVYYGSQPTATAEQYYDQAQTLADSASPSSQMVSPSAGNFTIDGTPPNAGDWKSLGVYSLVQSGQKNSTSVFQLAVDKAGIIRGNYANELTGDVQPVQGAVDKKTMRAAWTVGSNKAVVYDTGLDNLLQHQSSILVHFAKDRTEQWMLVKVEQPKTLSKT